VDLRNKLAKASGVRLPSTMVFDYPTSAAVAKLLLTEVGQVAAEPTATIAATVDRGGEGTLGTLLRHAHAAGAIGGTVPLLVEASRFRPSFTSAADLAGEEHVVRLASGGDLPKLVCVPSFVVGSGPHQFMRFADRFEGDRDVFACSLPGFRGTDLVPATWDAAIDVLADSIRRTVGDAPFVLVGYSIGGVVAHSLAARFEEAGTAPAGVVMIDTPTPEGEETGRVFTTVMTEILDRRHEGIAVDDANWLAMGTYLRLLAQRPATRIATRTLLVRAGERLGSAGGADWPAWDVGGDLVEVLADHFALIEAEVAATAEATERWLRA